jgi:hypothetical protein
MTIPTTAEPTIFVGDLDDEDREWFQNTCSKRASSSAALDTAKKCVVG